jgi:predicted nucleotidyltransferase component of viral defense system
VAAGLTNPQIIECFHLALLQVVPKRLDRGAYVLKGGANLRYFFDSVRYSEDIDLDVAGVEPWALRDKIDGILEGSVMKTLLRTHGLAVSGYSKPKQSDTTQRWKVAIAVSGRTEPVRTKIEFSRRNGETRFLLEPVPARVVEPYALRAPTIQHYLGDAAAEQKVAALAGRSETQARDVFDLDLLLRRHPLTDGSLDGAIGASAAERALALPFAAFRDQVVAFLDPEVAELYDSSETWAQMQEFVVEQLLGLRS